MRSIYGGLSSFWNLFSYTEQNALRDFLSNPEGNEQIFIDHVAIPIARNLEKDSKLAQMLEQKKEVGTDDRNQAIERSIQAIGLPGSMDPNCLKSLQSIMEKHVYSSSKLYTREADKTNNPTPSPKVVELNTIASVSRVLLEMVENKMEVDNTAKKTNSSSSQKWKESGPVIGLL